MSYQLVSSNLFVSAPFAEAKTMAAQIKPILQSDSAISTHLANAMLKKGSDDANTTSGIVSTTNIFDATSGINTNAYSNMLVSLAAFKTAIKALPAFTGVADGDIRIVFTDCNKCVGYDTAKTNTKANAFAKLSATSAASINECHVTRVEFSLAETANNGIAVNTRWSSTINALEHRVVFALRDSQGRVSGLLGISKPAV